jgi:pimeloyl-ACP methyl ester carboxylesterase
MREVVVRGYSREGGRENVREHIRHLARNAALLPVGSAVPQAAVASVASMVVSKKGNASVQLKNVKAESIKPTVSHLGAEQLAKAAYSVDANPPLPSGYQVAEKFADPKTGLAFSVFVSPQGKPVVSFRGTEGTSLDARDILTDVDPRGVGFGQFESNRQVLAQIASKYPGATVTGHSLGGALAQRYASEFNNASEVISFNAPGIDKATASKFKKGQTKVTHYVSNGDLASLGGETFIDGTAKIISYKSGKIPIVGNTLDKHMAAVEGGLIGMQYATVKTITAAELSNPNFKYGGTRATGFTDRRAMENRRKLAGVVAAPLNPLVGIAGQALGMIGVGNK